MELAHASTAHRIEAARVPTEPTVFDRRELGNAPAPVQRYFHIVLEDGQPIIGAVSVEHVGTFNMGEAVDRWKPFTSTQRVVTRRPGFDWDARVAIMPGLPVRVHHAYVVGEGILHAAVLGLVSVVNLHGTRELANGELTRFFAEAAWYPTALLPSQGVFWDGVDEHSARATLKDRDVTLTLLFRFDEEGLIDTVRAEARGRVAGGIAVPTPLARPVLELCSSRRHARALGRRGGLAVAGGGETYRRGRIATASASGRVTKKVVPAPSLLSTLRRPPWASTSPFAMLRPRPIAARFFLW